MYGFVGNDSVGTRDLLGLIIQCNCPELYFDNLGLVKDKDYTAQGETYSAIDGAGYSFAGSLEKEIVWKMLKSSRKFTANGLLVTELKRHVSARINAVAARKLVRWDFGNDSGFNPKFWSDQEGMVRADAAGGLMDMFQTNPGMYTRGCRNTAMLILLRGVLDVIGAKAFNDAIGTGGSITTRGFGAKLLVNDPAADYYSGQPVVDWVPGDVSRVVGKNPNHLFNGEWILYVGGSSWWGFGDPSEEQDLDAWIDELHRLSTDPSFKVFVRGMRIFPGVGLQR
jgi:hypothetical protein